MQNNCKHRYAMHCLYCCKHFGREIVVPNIVCEQACEFGKAVESPGEDRDAFLQSVRQSSYQIHRAGFYKKVKDSFNERWPIAVPTYWPQLKEVIAPLYALPFFKSFTLTGSSILKGKPFKDFDTAMHISDWIAFRDAMPQLRNIIPSEALGKKFDLFVLSDWYGMYPQLDCDNRILHIPQNFPMEGREVEKGIEIVKHDDGDELDMAVRISDEWYRSLPNKQLTVAAYWQ